MRLRVSNGIDDLLECLQLLDQLQTNLLRLVNFILVLPYILHLVMSPSHLSNLSKQICLKQVVIRHDPSYPADKEVIVRVSVRAVEEVPELDQFIHHGFDGRGHSVTSYLKVAE